MTTHTFTQMKTIYSFSDKCQVFRQQLFRTLHQHSLRSTPGWPPSPVSRWHRAHSYSYIFVHSAWPGGGGRHVLEWCRCPGRARTPASWPRRPDPGPGATRTPPPAPTPVSLLKSVPESARVYSARQYQAPRSYGEGWTLIQGFTMTSSSVKFSVRRSWQFLSVLFLLFVNVSIHTFFSFFPRSGESFIILILVNTLHFIPRCMDIYFV